VHETKTNHDNFQEFLPIIKEQLFWVPALWLCTTGHTTTQQSIMILLSAIVYRYSSGRNNSAGANYTSY